MGRDLVASIEDDQPFFEHGLVDSLHLVEIVDRIQGDLGIVVGGEDLSPENFGSISGLARFLDAKRVAGA